MPKAVLYYDGKCPLCNKEIALLQKLKSPELSLEDLWQVNIEIPKNELLTVLHFKNSNDEWITGLDANIAAWQYTPIGFLWWPLKWPLIRILADKAYKNWAKKRRCNVNTN